MKNDHLGQRRALLSLDSLGSGADIYATEVVHFVFGGHLASVPPIPCPNMRGFQTSALNVMPDDKTRRKSCRHLLSPSIEESQSPRQKSNLMGLHAILCPVSRISIGWEEHHHRVFLCQVLLIASLNERTNSIVISLTVRWIVPHTLSIPRRLQSIHLYGNVATADCVVGVCSRIKIEVKLFLQDSNQVSWSPPIRV